MKKVISLIIILTLLITSASAYAAEEQTNIGHRISPLLEKLEGITDKAQQAALTKFKDIKNHWAKVYIGKLVVLGIMGGYKDLTLKPDNKVAVDEFIAMTVKSMGFNPGGGTSYWAAPYIKIAEEQKLIDKGEYKNYQAAITREQATNIIIKAVFLKETGPNSNIYPYIRTKIKDYYYITDKYKQNVLVAYALGIVGGDTTGRFNPKNTLKRSEAAVMVYKQLDKKSRVQFKVDPNDCTQLSDYLGNVHTIYKAKPDRFNAIVSLKEAIQKSKGYAALIYSPQSQSVHAKLYENETIYHRNDIDTDMALSIETLDYEDIDHPYRITVFDCNKAKELHRDVIKGMFEYYFGSESNKAMAEFDKYLEIAKTEKAKENTFIINKRKILFYTVNNSSQLTIWIYEK